MQEVYSITDVGIARKVNQDFIFASHEPVGNLPNLFIVADGMGGHKAGDFASKCVVEVIVDEVKESSLMNSKDIITNAIQRANEVVYDISLANEDMHGMGTTLVVAMYEKNCLRVFNVGDSRLYVMKEELEQITIDHSYEEELVRKFGVDRNEARFHGNKGKITRAIGVAMELEVDYFELEATEGTTILMCSDGLTNMVQDQQIEQILTIQQPIMQKTVNLVETANFNGGKDNISVILMKI